MELQNISTDFEDNIITSLYTDVVYYIPTISNIETLRNQFNLIYNVDIKRSVAQLTFDQSLSESRIIINSGLDDIMIISIADISTAHPQLYDELVIARAEVVLEIQKQINPE